MWLFKLCSIIRLLLVTNSFYSKTYILCSSAHLGASRLQCGHALCVCEHSETLLSGSVCLRVRGHWCVPASRIQMSVSPFFHLTRARRRDDCFSGRVTNARTSIGFAGGRGILAVVRHLANSLIEVIHTHPSILVLSNKPG